MDMKIYTCWFALILIRRSRHIAGLAASVPGEAIRVGVADRQPSPGASSHRLREGLPHRIPLFEEDPEIQTLRGRIKR